MNPFSIVAQRTFGDHDLNEFESTLHEDAFTQVTDVLVNSFLEEMVFEKNFQKMSLYIPMLKFDSPSWPHPTLDDSDLNLNLLQYLFWPIVFRWEIYKKYKSSNMFNYLAL